MNIVLLLVAALAQNRFWDFEGDASGWTFSNSPLGNGGWAEDGTPSAVAGPSASASSAFSGARSLNYNNGTNYDFRGSSDSPYNTNRGTATSPAISIAGMESPVLRFWCNYDTETYDSRFDKRWIVVQGRRIQVYSSLLETGARSSEYWLVAGGNGDGRAAGVCAERGRWHWHEVPLVAGTSVQVAFEFEADVQSNAHEGWFIDDVAVLDKPKPVLGTAPRVNRINAGSLETPYYSGPYFTAFDSTAGWLLGGIGGIDNEHRQASAPASLNFSAMSLTYPFVEQSYWVPGPPLVTNVYYNHDGLAFFEMDPIGTSVYYEGVPVSGTAKSPPIAVAGMRGPVLRFACMYEVGGATTRRVLVSDESEIYGSPQRMVRVNQLLTVANCGAPNIWHRHEIPLSSHFGTVWVDFHFDSQNPELSGTRHPVGWFVDDFYVGPASGLKADVTAPDTTITWTSAGGVCKHLGAFTFDSTEAGSTFAVKFDGILHGTSDSTYNIHGLWAGSHRLTVWACDAAGNIDPTPAEYVWTITEDQAYDTVPPTTSVSMGPPSGANTAVFLFGSDDDHARFEVTMDQESTWVEATSPHVVSDLSEGMHTLYVRALDCSNNRDATPAQLAWTVDTTPPDTIFTSRPPDAYRYGDVYFGFGANESGATFERSIDGGPWTAATPQYLHFGEGVHVVAVRAKDAAGNIDPAPAEAVITIDWTAPVLSLTTMPPQYSNSATATFTFDCSEPDARVECSLNGGSYVAVASPYTTDSLLDGYRYAYFRAVDAAGNTSSHVYAYWTVDTIAPETRFSSTPPAATQYAGCSMSAATTDANPSSFERSLDDGPWTTMSYGYEYLTLAQGPHTYRVRAVDRAGNVDPTPAEWTWTIDTVAPVISMIGAPPYYSPSASATFTLSSSEPVEFRRIFDSSLQIVVSSPDTVAGLTDGYHWYYVYAVDAAGNYSNSLYAAWNVDTTVPETRITSAPPATTNSTSAYFGLSADGGYSHFERSLDGGPWTRISSSDSLYVAGGFHTYRVRAVDYAGNTDPTPAEHAWTVDSAAPVIDVEGAPPYDYASNALTLTLYSSKPGVRFRRYLDSLPMEEVESPDEMTGLAEGYHSYYVYAVDAAGNYSNSISLSWRVDTVAPETTFGSLPGSFVSTNSFWISFSSNESVNVYQRSLDGGPWTAVSSGSEYLSIGEGAHTYLARVTDRAGNVDPTPAVYNFVVDTAAPQTSIVSAPPATTTETTATVSFCSNEAGCTFRVTADATTTDVGTATSQTLAGLAPGTHTVSVTAVDAAGRQDPTPATVAWTVTAATPPSDPGSPPADPTPAPPDLTEISVNEAVTFTWSADYAERPSGTYGEFAVALDAQTTYVIETTAVVGDPYLYVVADGSGADAWTIVAHDDDGGAEPEAARVTFVPVDSGTYRVRLRAKAKGASGTCTLRISHTSGGTPSFMTTNQRFMWYTDDPYAANGAPPNVKRARNLYEAHWTDARKSYDQHAVMLVAGKTYEIECVDAPAIDPLPYPDYIPFHWEWIPNLGSNSPTHLYLVDASVSPAENADGSVPGVVAEAAYGTGAMTGTSGYKGARITFTAPSSGLYFIRARNHYPQSQVLNGVLKFTVMP